MGKIRIKTFGEEGEEKKEKIKEKKAVKVPGLKGGEKVVSVGPSLADLEKIAKSESKPEKAEIDKKVKKSKYKEKVVKIKVKSKKYIANVEQIKKDTAYTLKEAIKILKNWQTAAFDETVELHINVKEKGLSGQISLPHGTGKKTVIRVADIAKNAADLDNLISEIEKGKISFDILVATPASMVKLARVARVLGPRGLMPNPKAGTITNKPDELIEKLAKGQFNYKTEAEFPIIHLSVGKKSFTEKQLEENMLAVLEAINVNRIVNATLKSTMSPGIKLNITNLT